MMFPVLSLRFHDLGCQVLLYHNLAEMEDRIKHLPQINVRVRVMNESSGRTIAYSDWIDKDKAIIFAKLFLGVTL